MRKRHLEVQLQGHLDQPGSTEADDLAEGAAGDAAGGIVPVSVVQDVEEVGAELQLPALGELESPAHGDVEISLARPVDGVASEIAELAARRCRRGWSWRTGMRPCSGTRRRFSGTHTPGRAGSH